MSIHVPGFLVILKVFLHHFVLAISVTSSKRGKALCIETNTSLGSLKKFEGVTGEFKGALGSLAAPANFGP